MTETHEDDKKSGGIYSSHYPLIVAKEKDGKCSDAVDGDEEGSFLKAMDNVEAWDTFHGISDESEWGNDVMKALRLARVTQYRV